MIAIGSAAQAPAAAASPRPADIAVLARRAWRRGGAAARRACAYRAPPGRTELRTAAALRESSSDVPWAFGFQTNERYLSWDQSAQLRLLQLVLSDKLGCSVEEVQQRLVTLSQLLPDFTTRIQTTRVDVLLPLIEDLPGLTLQLVRFRELLPGINVSDLAAKHPRLLTDFKDPELLAARLAALRSALPGVVVPLLVAEEPHLLHVDIGGVLANCRRLMPGSDPVAVLVAQPRMVLNAVEAGLSSAMDVEGGVRFTQH